MSTAVIVVPCFNEAQRLYTMQFRRFAMSHPGVRFLMVNDGSRDHTLSLLEQLQASDPKCFDVLNLAQNCGKAEAVRRGVLQAARMGPDYIGFWDADLATPLEAIPQFTAVLDRRPDILLAIGVRLPLLGRAIRREPLRQLLGRTFCRVASYLLGDSFTDTQCGAKLFRARGGVLDAFSQPFHSRWIFDVELLARLVSMRRTAQPASLDEIVYELPVDRWEDVAGSKLKKADFVKAFVELNTIWWQYLRIGATRFTPAMNVADEMADLTPNQERRAA